ncbi:hypothetical protein CLOP_g2110 [Closterium sp. NIES-67]|nr:hypothetical protein CLOP_g2110 [Closterium sp. NIES-67]
MAADNNEDNWATGDSDEGREGGTESGRADAGAVTQTGGEEEAEAAEEQQGYAEEGDEYAEEAGEEEDMYQEGADGEEEGDVEVWVAGQDEEEAQGEMEEEAEIGGGGEGQVGGEMGGEDGGMEAEGEWEEVAEEEAEYPRWASDALLSFLEEQGESVVEPLYWSAVKKIVAGYIQANDLQRGKWITCDDALQALCDTDSTTQAQFYYTLATHYPVKSSVKVPRRLLKRQAEEEAAKMRGGDKEKGKGTRGGKGKRAREGEEQVEDEEEEEEEEGKREERRKEEEDGWDKDWSSREGVTQEQEMAEEDADGQMKNAKRQQRRQQQDEEAYIQEFDARPNPEPSPGRKRKRGRPPKASREEPPTTARALDTAPTAAAPHYTDPFASDPFSSHPDAPEVTDPFASPHAPPPPPPPPAPLGPECGYAAVTLANLGVIFLKRSQLEGLLADEQFDQKVVGTFVRIKVPSPANQTEACYRLVRVTGCTSQTDMYPVGKGLTNRVLLIMNLKTPEATTIDLVSNSEFTEDECAKLRQYMKWGLVDRLTVDEVVAKENELHELKVNDWLESERVKLTNLRDRASERGSKKEYPSAAMRCYSCPFLSLLSPTLPLLPFVCSPTLPLSLLLLTLPSLNHSSFLPLPLRYSILFSCLLRLPFPTFEQPEQASLPVLCAPYGVVYLILISSALPSPLVRSFLLHSAFHR